MKDEEGSQSAIKCEVHYRRLFDYNSALERLSRRNARDIALTSGSVVLLRRQPRTDARSMKMPYVKSPRMGPTIERETNTYNFAEDNWQDLEKT